MTSFAAFSLNLKFVDKLLSKLENVGTHMNIGLLEQTPNLLCFLLSKVINCGTHQVKLLLNEPKLVLIFFNSILLNDVKQSSDIRIQELINTFRFVSRLVALNSLTLGHFIFKRLTTMAHEPDSLLQSRFILTLVTLFHCHNIKHLINIMPIALFQTLEHGV